MERQRIHVSGHVPIGTESISTSIEYEKVVHGFNRTAAAYPQTVLIHELFEEWVDRSEDSVALLYEEQALTYGELNRKANQLARYLVGEGVQIGEYVAILMSRCPLMLIAQLAILKSGAVYVPIDPGQPEPRQSFMMRDSGVRRIVTDNSACDGSNFERTQSIGWTCISTAFANMPTEDLHRQIESLYPAYVMYTSGSTGDPKGVVVPHRAVIRLVINTNYVRIYPSDRIAHCSNPAFDASTFEIWAALLNGASVLVLPQSIELEASHFVKALRQHGVTTIFMTAGLFSQYVEEMTPVFSQLRYMLTGGDVLSTGVVRRACCVVSPAQLLNAYGPTECTTFSTTYCVCSADAEAKSVSIGCPISNTRVYILDPDLHPVPISTAGEIYIGGDGLALGYLNRPELTSKRFVADPFGPELGARLYKTGDLGVWRRDGTIEFLGRNDDQVKIRGFRVEPREIECALIKDPLVGMALVIPRDGEPGDKCLVAYVVSKPSFRSALSRAESRKQLGKRLRERLKKRLPSFMVPTTIVFLDSFPLTDNGKIDRRALPTWQSVVEVGDEYEAPVGPVEEALALIWMEVLRDRRVDRCDHFFDSGGDSLAAMRLVARVKERFSISDFYTHTVFRFPTLAEMAKFVETSLKKSRQSAGE